MGTDEMGTKSKKSVSSVPSVVKTTTNKQTERKKMNKQFDEITKSIAQAVTRRAALKKFGVGLAGMALACFGLADKTEAQTACLPAGYQCAKNSDCCSGHCKAHPDKNPISGGHFKVYICVS